jgi:threonine dehydrogenase-like Zn-dependent dehydrogenase
MRAAILENGQIRVGDMPDPIPARGQVLVRTHRCALCASDAHFLCSGETVVAKSREHGGPYAGVDLGKPIVMGHEFVGEVIDYGPGSRRPVKPGRRVTSIPMVRMGPGPADIGIVGYQNELPGGFGEYMILDEDLLLEVPNGLDDDLAALVEPLAVGLEHARVGEPQPGEVPLVIGCGAIGLGVIAGLKLKGVGPIVAADLDPGRRALAIAMGADVAIDPREASPYGPQKEIGGRTPNLVYECVGKPGLMNDIVSNITVGGRIVMGGFCLEPEFLYVPTAQVKALKINFARGEGPEDMALALRAISEGLVDMRPWLGGRIGLSGVGEALVRMMDPSSPVRTVVDPRVD